MLPVRFLRALVAAVVALAAASVDAGPVVVGAAGYVGPGHGPGYGYGGRWAGGPYYRPYYRPWVGPGWGGWRYGYPGYGYPGWGWGWGFGYGAGWAIATGPAWGWPAPGVAYVAPSWVPQVTAVPAPAVEEAIVEPPAAAPRAAPQQPGYWYYCTEPAGYYPYVQECSRPWIAVQPTAK